MTDVREQVEPVACGDRMTVYYDGSCPLCTAEIGHYRKLDKNGAVDFADVSSPTGEPGPDLAREAAMARFHVRTPDGRLLSGAAAFAALWRTMPGPWRMLGLVAGWRPLTLMLEGLYRAFLPVRPALSRAFGRFRGLPASAPTDNGTPAGRSSG
jgi:predicted DCC family thiol-disulfide oxidoreductase YuxK